MVGGEEEPASFAFLKLPRELRDHIYNHVFCLPDPRSERALRIERRNLKYFAPSPASILLVLHHEYLLLNRQIAREALELLLKRHTVFFSCGPFVLKSLLERIEQHSEHGKHWLKCMKDIQLDWVTFPNLKQYPPDREEGRDQWYWEQDDIELDISANEHYNEYDHEGNHYDDNLYEPSNASLYPSFNPSSQAATNPNDPFGFANHYPFTDPVQDQGHDASAEDITKLDLLVSMEVTPLFTYLASPTFNLTSITLPLYFISKQSHHYRSAVRPGFALPLKIRFWVHVCVHALLMLRAPSPPAVASSSSHATSLLPALQEVRVKYLPWDIWASMDPADDLHRMTEEGIWFEEPEEGEEDEREGEGEAFRAVWAVLGSKEEETTGRNKSRSSEFNADVKFVPWDGNVDSWRVGDELEIVFTSNGGG